MKRLGFAFLLVAGAAYAAAPLQERKTYAVSGTITLKGEIPRRQKLRLDADPKCAAMHGDDPLFSDELVADSKGHLQWALVYVKDGLGERKFEIPPAPVIVEQKGCRFLPHVFGVMAGQEVMFRNHDALIHIIHVVPRNNREFGFSQEKPGEERVKVFANPEFIRVKCDVHPWMTSWAAVLPHPCHSVTGQDGKFSIPDLAPGKYTLEVWHEKFKPLTREIEVKEGNLTVDFSFEQKKE